MGFKRFLISVVGRLALVIAALAAFVFLWIYPGFHAATLLMAGIVAASIYGLYHYVSKTNNELVRFLDAARYADFGQRFQMGKMGAGFEELGDTFTAILERFRDERSERESRLRHFKAIIEHVPVPLISIQGDDRITLWNNAARRLFGNAAVTRTDDLSQFSSRFREAVLTTVAGARTLAPFQVDGIERQLTVAVTQVVVAGRPEKLISLQDIQSELDTVQLSAWQDLVRVLTHEIMNSITPVASLARTAVDLVSDARQKAETGEPVSTDLEDAQGAVETVARRSDGLMQFVGSYRKLTRMPPPARTRFRLADLFASVGRLAEDNLKDNSVALRTHIDPDGLELHADRDLVEQILLNLIQNAVQALASASTEDPALHLIGRLNSRGHVTIQIADNGPGVPADVAPKIFVPFFTTKRDGSGVGLALTRQVMIAHGGHVRLSDRRDAEADPGLPKSTSGAVFTLTF